MKEVQEYFETEKPHLNPELNLITLSRKLNIPLAQLSQIINDGFDKKINDFGNNHRVEAIKVLLNEGKQKKNSLYSVSLWNVVFSTKATLNRGFRRITGKFPTV